MELYTMPPRAMALTGRASISSKSPDATWVCSQVILLSMHARSQSRTSSRLTFLGGQAMQRHSLQLRKADATEIERMMFNRCCF